MAGSFRRLSFFAFGLDAPNCSNIIRPTVINEPTAHSVLPGKRGSRTRPLMLLTAAITAHLFSLLMTGCGGTPAAWQSAVRGTALHGSIRAGQHPVGNASIQLYAAGTSGDGSVSTPLLAKPVKSDANGAFAINESYSCPSSSSLVYLTSTGGNPGLAAGTDNTAAALMRILGTCSELSSSSAIGISEVTTAASVLPLAPFMNSYAAVGSGNADAANLNQAFDEVKRSLNPDGSMQTNAAAIAAEKATSLAGSLLPCVASAGGTADDGSACGQLFGQAEAQSGIPVTETIGAALQLTKSVATGAVNTLDNSDASDTSFQPVQSPSKKSSPVKAAAQAADAPATPSAIPPNSVFTPPAPNACQSKYDQYYESEPGIYAYWALCEAGSPMQIYDYLGAFDLSSAAHSWGSGTITGGAPGPVNDGETAASIPTENIFIENQGIPMNTNQGTLSLWLNGSALNFPATAAFFGAVGGKSAVTLSISASPNGTNGMCFNGTFTNLAGTPASAQNCGYVANTWHRVVITWTAGTLTLYVDGASVSTAAYTGTLDNTVFYYKLFPGCCNSGQMTLAKVAIANEAWGATQVAADFAPAMPSVPTGGVYISSTKLGTIHKDVLGVADYSQNISTPALQSALLSGLTAGGVTSLRYSGGRGLKMDLEDWQNNDTCTSTPGAAVPVSAQGAATANTIDTYLPTIAQPLGLDVVYTANYGSNPSLCTAGGDPVVNGANLVQYANQTKNYAIKRWEVGNELYSTNTTDFHPNPNAGASYTTYEPAYYAAMKAIDPTIQIGVPVALTTYAWQTGFDFPVLSGAKYDAVVFHNYPMKDPITDGATLYQDRVTSNMSRTHGALLKLQTELMNSGKSPGAIWITEWDAQVLGDLWSKQTMGAVMPLFAATQLAEYMQAGVEIATWWNQGGTDVCSTMNYDGDGETAYSWWECGMGAFTYTGPMVGVGEVSVGLQPGDLTPAARAFQLLSQSGFVTEGERMLRTQVDVQNAPWLLAYAGTHGTSEAVILINRDRDNAHTVPMKIAKRTSGTSAQQWTYGRAQYDNSSTGNWSVGPVTTSYGAWTNIFQATLPPWSVNVIVFSNN